MTDETIMTIDQLNKVEETILQATFKGPIYNLETGEIIEAEYKTPSFTIGNLREALGIKNV